MSTLILATFIGVLVILSLTRYSNKRDLVGIATVLVL
ncbi:hypothetical protein FMV2238Y02_13630 [Streptococcus canis]|uniref:Uncharacterized protein n=1 Tax=Streptococcus canis TaxID=1329 RepID=A0A3P5XZV0_STRCB|nr:hypothetical protein FMV2238Y02_13630 [Streptococcus canis]